MVADLFRAPSLESKWEEVKAYYESCYRDERNRPIRFKTRLSEDQIEFCWAEMKKMQRSEALRDWSDKQTILESQESLKEGDPLQQS